MLPQRSKPEYRALPLKGNLPKAPKTASLNLIEVRLWSFFLTKLIKTEIRKVFFFRFYLILTFFIKSQFIDLQCFNVLEIV
jgi:hypothetical protein